MSQALDEREGVIRHALNRSFPDVWTVAVYDDHAIVSQGSPLLWRVDYSISGSDVTFTPRDAWVRVEREYVPVSTGSAVKILGSSGAVGGYLVVFGDPNSPDLDGEFFTKSTAFGIEDGDIRPVFYHHGLDATLKRSQLGRAKLTIDDVGVWVEAQLNLRDAFEQAVYKLAAENKVGWSSGTAGHLVERKRAGKATEIVAWPIAEASLTPTPAEPRARVRYVKSIQELALTFPEATPEGSSGPAVVVSSSKPDNLKSAMEGTMEQGNERIDALESSVKGIGDQMSELLKLVQGAPALSGYTSVDGGTADKTVKSLGDWALALMRGDHKRLESVYKSTMVTNEGGLGGYAVPTDFSTVLLTAVQQQSQVYARVRRFAATTMAGEWPTLDTFTAPTAGSGQTAQAAGVKASKRAEGASYTETEANLEMLRWRLNDAASGMLKVTKELRQSAAIAVEQLLRTLIGTAISARMEYYILRGTGVGEPLGILNAAARINVDPITDGTFAYGDAVAMISRFKAAGGAPVWLMHPGLITDVGNMAVGANSPATWNQDLAAQLRGTLLGYPMITSEHLPNPDTSGCAVLADLGAYALWEMGSMYVEFSEHAAFTEGKDVWRFGLLADGQPWWKGTQTLASPSSFTVSPFVALND